MSMSIIFERWDSAFGHGVIELVEGQTVNAIVLNDSYVTLVFTSRVELVPWSQVKSICDKRKRNL